MKHPDDKRGVVERIGDAIAFWLHTTRGPAVLNGARVGKPISLVFPKESEREVRINDGCWMCALTDDDVTRLAAGTPAWEIQPEHYRHLPWCGCPKCESLGTGS